MAPRAGGKDARPGDREPIGVEAAARQPFNVLDPAMIVVAGDVAGVAILHRARRVREHVPDALAAPVLLDRAFDLIARGRSAPDEIRRETRLPARLVRCSAAMPTRTERRAARRTEARAACGGATASALAQQLTIRSFPRRRGMFARLDPRLRGNERNERQFDRIMAAFLLGPAAPCLRLVPARCLLARCGGQ